MWNRTTKNEIPGNKRRLLVNGMEWIWPGLEAQEGMDGLLWRACADLPACAPFDTSLRWNYCGLCLIYPHVFDTVRN